MKYRLIQVVKQPIYEDTIDSDKDIAQFLEYMFKNRCKFTIKISDPYVPRNYYESAVILDIKEDSIVMSAPNEGNCQFVVEYKYIDEIEYTTDKSEIYKIAGELNRFHTLDIVDDEV
jgi:hypothetical protein